ncbi:hypothetical protein PM085_15510 [Halorubrum ezzemoulense]|uniref:Uncharacterized protein n=1 Tax=Halorubrum ezzemoulense TaxID=337243 RepID=A0ABT4Z664_HALEZ|nr:hypothetical protein [Halorubrum ezzemoulense]MDB2293664.1 hypothetical protein [Halorubrum ezzemoulense]
MSRVLFVALLVALASLFGATAVVQANGSDVITVENGEVDVPDQPVEIDPFGSYNVSSVAPIKPGEQIEVSVSKNTDERFNLYLYDANKNPVKSTNTTESTVTFDSDDLSAGTYILAYFSNETLQTVQPVVIQGYETTVTAPSTVAVGDNGSVNVTLTAYDGSDEPSIESVGVVLVDGEQGEPIPATKEGDTYTAPLDDEYEPGDYRLYAVVNGSGQVAGQFSNILSVSDEQSLTITEETADESGDTGNNGGSGGGGGGGGGSAAPVDNTTSESVNETTNATSENKSVEVNSTGQNVSNTTKSNVTADGEANTTNATGSEKSDPSGNVTGSTQDTGDNSSQVTEPSEPNPDQNTDESVPLNGPTLLLISLFVIGAVTRLRN